MARTTMSALGLIALAVSGLALAMPSQERQTASRDVKASNENHFTWSDCAETPSVMDIQFVDITPDPAQAGAPLVLSMAGQALQVIDQGASALVTVKIGEEAISSRFWDLCDEVHNDHRPVRCPLEPGLFFYEQAVFMPSIHADYTIVVHGTGVTGQPLFCTEVRLDLTN